jgi:hypothetical protein
MTIPDDASLSEWLEPSLRPLCRVEAQLAQGLSLPDTPAGSRMIVEVLSGRFEGERLKASLKGRAAADWLVLSQDRQLGLMDVRCTIETDDGVLIYLQYNGRVQTSAGNDRSRIYVAPRFETGDERYAWLNKIQAIGKGFSEPATGRLSYMFYVVD